MAGNLANDELVFVSAYDMQRTDGLNVYAIAVSFVKDNYPKVRRNYIGFEHCVTEPLFQRVLTNVLAMFA